MTNEHAAEWKVVETRRIAGRVQVVTGLRIGGSQEMMEISGLDNPIIRNPANDEPYLPGSSLKGKMRALTEWYFGELPGRDGDPTQPRAGATTARVFGVPASKERKVGPTRLIVRDAPLTEKSRAELKAGRPITEVKTENSINRLTAMANPRPMERVLPGVTFGFELVYRVLDTGDGGTEDRANFDRVVLTALALLEADYLGSCGTRGCGQIRFLDLKDERQKPIELPKLDATAEARPA